ncbi:hypothetical protein CLOP_g23176, partial [Closterium sp. NIES-67]
LREPRRPATTSHRHRRWTRALKQAGRASDVIQPTQPCLPAPCSFAATIARHGRGGDPAGTNDERVRGGSVGSRPGKGDLL